MNALEIEIVLKIYKSFTKSFVFHEKIQHIFIDVRFLFFQSFSTEQNLSVFVLIEGYLN